MKLEYLYTDLGNISYATAYLPGSTFAPPGFNYAERITQDLTFHTVRVGLNYKFGGAGSRPLLIRHLVSSIERPRRCPGLFVVPGSTQLKPP